MTHFVFKPSPGAGRLGSLRGSEDARLTRFDKPYIRNWDGWSANSPEQVNWIMRNEVLKAIGKEREKDTRSKRKVELLEKASEERSALQDELKNGISDLVTTDAITGQAVVDLKNSYDTTEQQRLRMKAERLHMKQIGRAHV